MAEKVNINDNKEVNSWWFRSSNGTNEFEAVVTRETNWLNYAITSHGVALAFRIG